MAASGPVVLLVEDNAKMRKLIRSLVEAIASQVHECESGESAVALYRHLHPDWVLMDIAIEGIDGIEATRIIRSMDPAARVVVVTDHGDQRHRNEAANAGASAFVLKENLLELPSLLRAGTEP